MSRFRPPRPSTRPGLPRTSFFSAATSRRWRMRSIPGSGRESASRKTSRFRRSTTWSPCPSRFSASPPRFSPLSRCRHPPSRCRSTRSGCADGGAYLPYPDLAVSGRSRPRRVLLDDEDETVRRPRRRQAPHPARRLRRQAEGLVGGLDKFQNRRAHGLDDQCHALRVRVNAIRLKVALDGPCPVGEGRDAGEEVRKVECLVSVRQFGIHRVERRLELRAVVRRRLHADEQNRQVPLPGDLQNAFEACAARRRIETAQKIVAAEGDDHAVDGLVERPLDPGEPAGGGVAGHTGIAQFDLGTVILEPARHLRHESLGRPDPVALSETVAEGKDGHRLRRRDSRTQAERRTKLEDWPGGPICQTAQGGKPFDDDRHRSFPEECSPLAPRQRRPGGYSEGHHPRCGARRDARARRSVGLWQIIAPHAHGRARTRHWRVRGRARPRSDAARRRRACTVPPRSYGRGVPVFPPYSDDDGARERRDTSRTRGRARCVRPCGCGAARGRSRRPVRPLPLADVGRRTAAGRACPRRGAETRHPPRRRAHRQSRRGDRRSDHGVALRPAGQARLDARPRHPRPGTRRPLRPRCPVARRTDRGPRTPGGGRMSLALAARIAGRELRGGLKGFRVFLACLALGVAAIAAVGSVRYSIGEGLEREGAAILGGDAEIGLTYRFAEPEERAWIEDTATEVSEIVDFRSLATADGVDDRRRGLTQVKGVDAAYPLYGEVRLEPAMSLSEALAGKAGLPGAVMDPVLIGVLDIEVGDTIRLGTQDFVLSAALLREPDSAGGGFELGPRTIVLTADLADSGLLSPGTLFESAYRMRLPDGADLAELRAEAGELFTGARWRDRRNGAPGVSEFVDRLGAFLVLVGLAGLAVGGVGVSAAVRAYLDRKTAVVAILRTLGAEASTIFLTYFIQVGALALVGIAAGLVLGAALPIVFAPLIADALPVPAVFAVHLRPLAEAALYGALAALLFTLWPLARAEEVRAAALFRDAAGGLRTLPRPLWLGATAAILAALVATAAAFSGLVDLTLATAGGILGAFVLLLLAAAGIRRLARVLARSPALRGRTTLRLALGAVGGPGSEAGSVVLSLGLGLTVLAAVGQIDANLRGAIERDLPKVAPSFFMVDIQTAQLDPFLGGLRQNPAVSRVETAPMLRGIITGIDGRPAAETGGDHWVLQGDRGITYSAAPPEGAVVTHGQWWPEDYDGPPQVSFATEEAMEIGLELGDTITVDVLGRPITATVTSFREVDFSTAGIGFILSMNPAADAEPAILRETADTFPNITAIRVKDAIERVSDVLGGIAAAVTYGSAATLLTGFIVLIGAAAAGERARTYEAAILKTIGGSRGYIHLGFALRYAMLGAAAGAVAIFAGGIGGWAVSTYVMDTAYVFEPVSAAAIVLGGILATLAAGLVFAWRPLSARPARVLRSRE